MHQVSFRGDENALKLTMAMYEQLYDVLKTIELYTSDEHIMR